MTSLLPNLRQAIVLQLLLGLTACTADKAIQPKLAESACNSSLTYTNAVKNIMDTKCALSGCHDAQMPGGGFNFAAYGVCYEVATAHNILLCTIRHDTCGYKPMPYPVGSPKLNDSLINIISCWVSLGAPF